MKKLIIIMLLLIAVSAKCQTDNNTIVRSFHQGAANNCASIAIIKAAMLRFGYDKMYTYKKQGSTYQITLRDGTILNVTESEYAEAKKAAKFILEGSEADVESSGLFYAYLSYSIIAKYIQNNGYWGCDEEGNPHFPPKKDYKHALDFITNTSFCTDNCYRLLGLKIKGSKIYDYTSDISLRDKGTIIYSQHHAVVVDNSKLDCFGNWLDVAPEVCGQLFKWYIILDN